MHQQASQVTVRERVNLVGTARPTGSEFEWRFAPANINPDHELPTHESPMHEDYRFLNLHGERIFTAHHYPSASSSRVIVMCHPLGEEKLWAHRVFVSFARDLAAVGFSVLRFDFRGEGDSDREFEQTDLETRIEDTNFAIDAAKDFNPSVKEVTLLGARLGAGVAAVTAARRSDVARLVLWEPIVDGAAYMQAVLRINLLYQMKIHGRVVETRDALVSRLANGETVNIEGYELAEPLFRQVSEFRMLNAIPQFAGETLIVNVNQGEAPVSQDSATLTQASHRTRVDAVQEEPFWKETRVFCRRSTALTAVTRDWLGPLH